MLNISPNPYKYPILKFFKELKTIVWSFPYLMQVVNSIIILIILLILFVLYLTIGVISQISLTFWDLIVGITENMKFSQPIENTAYALAAAIYFVLFLPFFILQSPVWLAGWIASKVNIRVIVAILIISFLSVIYSYYGLNLSESARYFATFKNELKTQFSNSDSTNINTDILGDGITIKKKKLSQFINYNLFIFLNSYQNSIFV